MRSSDEEIRASIDSVEKRKGSTPWASESLENILLMLRTEQEIRERWTSVAPELSQQVAHNTERVLRQAPESEELTIRRVLGEYDDLWGSICNFAEINLGNSNLPPAELLGRLIDAQRSKVGNDYFDPFPLSNLKKGNESAENILLIAIGIIDYVLATNGEQDYIKRIDSYNENSLIVRIRLAIIKRLIQKRLDFVPQQTPTEAVVVTPQWVEKSREKVIGQPPQEQARIEWEQKSILEKRVADLEEEVRELRKLVDKILSGQSINPPWPLSDWPNVSTWINEDISMPWSDVRLPNQDTLPPEDTHLNEKKRPWRRSQLQEQAEKWITQIQVAFQKSDSSIYDEFRNLYHFGRGFWEEWSKFCKKYKLPCPPEDGAESIQNYYKRIFKLTDAKKGTILDFYKKVTKIVI